ncbi:MAG: polysaccharide deacetylase family protein [Actinomycetota bacterium]|nr:polysaccharide deacetylase family protein [Actinomycetota bacterium]
MRKAALVAMLVAAILAVALTLPGEAGTARAASPPRVALTFDDGYGFDHRVLDYLNSQGITATAFVVGAWAQNNTHLLQEMDALGWEVCNHTQTHPWLTKIPDDIIRAELNACQSVISSATGQFQPWFRPPGGFIDDRVRAVISSTGYVPVMWDLDSMDSHGTDIPVQDRVDFMVSAAGDGSNILFHFGGRNTYELVTGVVQGLQERGFCFVTVGELYGWKDQVRGGVSMIGQGDGSPRRYFAEGTTRQGFEEWILVMNPGDKEAELRVGFFSPQGHEEKEYLLSPRDRLSISVNREIPWQDDVSVILECDTSLAAERMLYFNSGSGHSGATISQGADSASTRHYFPEGTVRDGFEEYLAVFNPSGLVEARVSMELYGEGGKSLDTEFALPPYDRLTLRINDFVEEGDYSMVLDSVAPVVAERSQHFVYNNIIAGAHCDSGINEPSGEWFFAEGTTRRFFNSYLTLFNPCLYSTWLKVRFIRSDGAVSQETISLAAGERKTLDINTLLPPDLDYSCHLYSLLPVVAERTAYFQSNNVQGGCCSKGAWEAREHWVFAEGCTSQGFNEWLALFNPGGEETVVTVDYILGEGEDIQHSYYLPPEGRATIDVVAEAGRDSEVSIEVLSERPVVAERSIYFSRSAW